MTEHDKTAFNVLLAGHRENRLPNSRKAQEQISQRLREAVREISSALGDSDELRLLTGSADGTDEMALDLGKDFRQQDKPSVNTHLIVPGRDSEGELQKRAEKYSLKSVLSLGAPGEKDLPELAYEMRDETALALSDLLIIVWDGKEPEGKAGTVMLLWKAAQKGIPVIWVPTESEHPKITKHNYLTTDLSYRLKAVTPDLSSYMQDKIFKDAEPGDIQSRIETARLGADEQSLGLETNIFTKLAGRLNSKMTNTLGKAKSKDNEQEQEQEQKQEQTYSPIEGLDNTTSTFGSVKEKADARANIAGGLHRDSIWLLHGLAAAAVLMAIAGAVLTHKDLPKVLVLATGVGEAMILGTISLILWRVRKTDWHQQWVEQRFLAEQLRYAEMNLPLALAPKLCLKPPFEIRSRNDASVLEMPPTLRKLQREYRNHGLPKTDQTVFCPADHLKSLVGSLSSQIKDQIHYHEDRGKKYGRVHHRIERIIKTLFLLTIVAVGLHLTFHWFSLLFATAFFPALAGALHAINSKLEFQRLHLSSKETAVRLATILKALEDTLEKADPTSDTDATKWQNYVSVRAYAAEAAALMSDENDQWQSLLSVQKAETPA